MAKRRHASKSVSRVCTKFETPHGVRSLSSISAHSPELFPCVSRKPEVDPSEEGQKHTGKSPSRAVTPPPAAPQPYPAAPHPPTQASRPQHAPYATSESRNGSRELTTSPHLARQALPPVALPQPSPCLPRRTNPPTSGEDGEYSEGQSFGDMNVDDDFWDHIDGMEFTGERGTPASPSLQGSRTAASNRSSGATRDVIALDDDESDEPDDWIVGTVRNKETVSDRYARGVTPPLVQATQPRPGNRLPTQVQEVIDLSD